MNKSAKLPKIPSVPESIKQKAGFIKNFEKFILRGNVVDLAVAVVVGAAFTGIVTAFVKDLVTPLIAAFYKQKAFASAYVTFRGSQFMYGDFINALINFLIVAAIVYFCVVAPINKLLSIRNRKQTTPEPTTRKCPECLSEIPLAAKRCAFCTATL